MHWVGKFDLFLLDMDGLLVDTEKLHYQAYKTLCDRHNYQMPWDYFQYLDVAHSSGSGLREALLPQLGGNDWESLYAEKKKIYMSLLNQGKISLMPGVEAFLKELATLSTKRCVATNSSKEQVEAIKHFLPILKTIPLWITREDYENPKPSPDAYLRAIELLAEPGDKVVGFEDSLKGVEALSKTMAMPVLICEPNHPQMRSESLSGVHHFSSFTKIPKDFSRN